eukprot:CAMPEP_0172487732 /NCGR_PEP_ID=MMETSP1066-20121228/16923_1 /TAXON_ID=671091 /ORGANISM="Coscinodiscus wailesii, Strain CCMP2513" /LENGTH=253 /DNA_ID=CAMNT_0013254523 /DNA_START=81 /DNA_END=842 /DNA_ORIENTATION=+
MVSKTKCIKELRTKTVTAADDFLIAIPQTLSEITTAIDTNFPYAKLSKAEEAFEAELTASGLDAANTTIAKIVPCARDSLYTIVNDIQTCERFISLHVPPMEDGNNFGVSVQMTISKVLKDMREEFEKKMDVISKYYSGRADAVEKLNLPKVTVSESKTKTDSDSTGGKDGDEKKASTQVVVKEETTQTGLKKENYYRLKHLVALDVQFYAEMKSLCVNIADAYAIILDNMEKNKEKLKAPKGTGGGNSMSMF